MSATPPVPEPAPVWTAREAITVLVLGLGGFLANFDVTSVVVAMPAIAKDLGFGVVGYAWVMDAYSLAFTGALLAAGALADRYGRRRVLLLGNLVFLAASILCALAWNGPALWAARVAQGVGAACLVTGSLALVAAAFPDPRRRARVFGLLGAITGVAMALGPSLGGFLTSWFGWRWIFFANVPCCALLAVAVPAWIAESRDDAARPLDPIGIALLTASLGAFVDALLRAHVAPAIAGAALLAAFVHRQRQSAAPLLDPRIFGTRAMAAIGVLLSAVSIGYWAVLVYLPPFLDAAFAWTVDATGVAMMAATLPMLVVPILGGRLATAWGWRRLFAVALGIVLAGDAALIAAAWTDDPALRFPATLLGMALIGIGAALAHPQLSGAVLALAPSGYAGMASAVTIVARQAGFALGIAALGAALHASRLPDAYAGVFALAALAAAIGAAAALLLPRVTPRGS